MTLTPMPPPTIVRRGPSVISRQPIPSAHGEVRVLNEREEVEMRQADDVRVSVRRRRNGISPKKWLDGI
jgi:hypothetical protein